MHSKPRPPPPAYKIRNTRPHPFFLSARKILQRHLEEKAQERKKGHNALERKRKNNNASEKLEEKGARENKLTGHTKNNFRSTLHYRSTHIDQHLKTHFMKQSGDRNVPIIDLWHFVAAPKSDARLFGWLFAKLFVKSRTRLPSKTLIAHYFGPPRLDHPKNLTKTGPARFPRVVEEKWNF